jgi:shikimate kinase
MRPLTPSSEPLPPTVALTGFMAAGKSTVGRALANLLHWRSCDLDCEIEYRQKLRVREIFERQGEAVFRKLEADALRAILESTSVPTVIALGGGTFVETSNADLLRKRGAHVVFLEIAVEQLLHRCRAASARCPENPRPLAEDAEAFRALYARRLPSYRTADIVVSTEGKTIDQIAREIAAALQLTPRP